MKIFNVFTNEINVSFNYEKIYTEYDFVRIEHGCSNDFFSCYKNFYSRMKKDLKPKAHVLTGLHGRQQVIAAFDKGEVPPNTSFDMAMIGKSDLEGLKQRSMMKLMLSLLVNKSSFFNLIDDPYGLYYIHSENKSGLLALNVDIPNNARGLYLKTSAVNFKRTVRKEDSKVVVEGSVLIPYDSEKHEGRVTYTKGNYKGRKSLIPFMSFNGEEYKNSKVYFISQFYQSFKTHLGHLVDLNFFTLNMNEFTRGINRTQEVQALDETIKQYMKSYQHLHIADLSNSECSEHARKVYESFNEIFCEDMKISFSTDIMENVPNITITMPAQYYKENNKTDPYLKMSRSSTPIQNITSDTKVDKVICRVLIKELAIKCEIINGKKLIEHNTSLEGLSFFSVENKKEEQFYKATVRDGNVNCSLPSEKEQVILSSLMFEVNNGDDVECIVMSEDEDIALISKSIYEPLPDFIGLRTLYDDSMKPYKFSTKFVSELISEDRRKKLIEISRKNKDLSEVELLQTFYNKLRPEEEVEDFISENDDNGEISANQIRKTKMNLISKAVKNSLEIEAGRPLRFLPRGAENKKLFASMLGISYVEVGEEMLYHTGIADDALKSADRNSPFRRVRFIKGKIDIEQILSSMEHYFVRNKELTVLPYPLKYAREAFKYSTN